MRPSEYPLFIPPADLAAKPHREWSAPEADRYMRWLLDSMENRIGTLLEFLGEKAKGHPEEEVLLRLGAKAEEVLQSETLSTGSPRNLTDRGYALAADIGLVVANLLLETCAPAVHWEVLRKPKSDASYNLPVLSGFGNELLEPIGVSVANALAVVQGRRSSDVWKNIFCYLKEKYSGK